jgi:glycosyltransferase involved in cell wall biosynthesis
LGVSEFNRQELVAAGFPVTGILPVVPDFSHLDVAPDQRVYNTFDDENTNILFVGRLIGNKRPDNLIRYAHAYRTHFNPDSRLIIAGSHEHFGGYLAELHAFAARLGASGVHLLGQVTNEELTALYDIADVFLCASEHEGYCVPIVESFFKRVPVIARRAAAVPATMDGGGILYDTDDPLEVAGLIDAVMSDESLEDQVLRSQDAALARMQSRDFAGLLNGFVQQAVNAPLRTAVAVDPGFWRQFRLADELEAIRESRPSAFHALPAEPAQQALLADVGDRR